LNGDLDPELLAMDLFLRYWGRWQPARRFIYLRLDI
jgi:hypothetical protein